MQSPWLIAAVYAESPAGGGAHIVLDDWNLEDDNIQYCLDQPDVTRDEERCLLCLGRLNLEQRAMALDLYHRYVAGGVREGCPCEARGAA